MDIIKCDRLPLTTRQVDLTHRADVSTVTRNDIVVFGFCVFVDNLFSLVRF